MSKKVTKATDKRQETGEDYAQKRAREFEKSWEIKKKVNTLLREAHKNLSEANALLAENQELLISCYSYLPSVMTDYGYGDHAPLFKPFDSILEAALARVTHLGSDLFAHEYTFRPDRFMTDAEKIGYLQERVYNRTKWLDPNYSCEW